ncbi:MAG: peptidoglycan recognition family protein [Candidatus Kerfeldbacteria bacterium]
MNSKITKKLFVFGTIAIMMVVFLSTQVHAVSQAEVKQGQILDQGIINSESEYLSPIYEAEFEFNIIGFSWQGQEGVDFSLRYYNDNDWSKWYIPESADSTERDGWHYGAEPIIANQGIKFQYKLEDTRQVDLIKVIYLDSINNKKAEWNIFDWLFEKVSAATTVDIINRAGWGADEDWRFDSEGTEDWPTEYQWPEKIILHHTAGDAGTNNPEATIRGIYYWHAVISGWGDIGYNYLIDQSGKIYEGRAGGDGVIGAHAYRSSTCAALRFGDEFGEASFNNGTVGISILGDYESGLVLNPVVKQALIDLIGVKSAEFGIDPSGEGHFVDDVYPNIVGHKDVDCTNCPGANLYSQMSDIRSGAKLVYDSLGGSQKEIVKATLINQSEDPIQVMTGQEKEVWVDFRNDGNVTWRNYGSGALAVVPKNISSNFYVAAWESPAIVASLATANVAPGEVGRFIFTIQGPTDQLELSEEFELTVNGESILASNFTLTAQVGGFQYATVLDNQEIRPATFTSAGQTVTLQFTNRGTQTWSQGQVKLNIYDLGDKVSMFYDKSWADKYGQIDFTEAEVKSGELATFTFKFKSPSFPGLFLNVYRLTGIDNFIQPHDYSITRVDSMFKSELVSYSIPPAIMYNWNLPITIKYKNTGVATWDKNMNLRLDDLGGAVSRFYDKSWPSSHVATYMTESTVKPGSVGTFSFRLKGPGEPGLFLNTFYLEYPRADVEGGEFYLITRVDK